MIHFATICPSNLRIAMTKPFDQAAVQLIGGYSATNHNKSQDTIMAWISNYRIWVSQNHIWNLQKIHQNHQHQQKVAPPFFARLYLSRICCADCSPAARSHWGSAGAGNNLDGEFRRKSHFFFGTCQKMETTWKIKTWKNKWKTHPTMQSMNSVLVLSVTSGQVWTPMSLPSTDLCANHLSSLDFPRFHTCRRAHSCGKELVSMSSKEYQQHFS